MSRFLLTLIALPLLTGAALAQDAAEPEAGRAVRYNERTEIDFDALNVTGELVRPHQSLILETRKAQFNPLFRLRENFSLEMNRSVDAVK